MSEHRLTAPAAFIRPQDIPADMLDTAEDMYELRDMTPAELDAFMRAHEANPATASQVVAEACRRVLDVHRRLRDIPWQARLRVVD